MAYEEKIKVLEMDLETNNNMFKYSESVNDNITKQKQDVQARFDESVARFNRWKESFKNLTKLDNSSMSVKTKMGWGIYAEYIGNDEVYDPCMYSIFDNTLDDVGGYQNPVKFLKV